MSASRTWIVLFRGVGGSTQLPTAPLRAALTDAGFSKAETYINSGNAVVSGPFEREQATSLIADRCRRRFGFDKAIYLRSPVEWSTLISNNPFPHAVSVAKFLHAAVLAHDPAPQAVRKLEDAAGKDDGFAVVERVAYLHTPRGLSQSKLGKTFDAAIGVPNTARNWNTVLRLDTMARAQSS